MSSHDASDAPEAEELQFENAEYDAPPAAVSCIACNREISDTYFELNGKVFCPVCRAAVDAHRTGGSGLGRFFRALFFGTAAAFGGFLIYFGVMKITGMEIGLISVLVGLMVGGGVRKGSNHRGGWFYQLLAVFLTYSAVAASYSAQAFSEFLENPPKREANAPANAKKAGETEAPPNAGPAVQPPVQPGAQPSVKKAGEVAAPPNAGPAAQPPAQPGAQPDVEDEPEILFRSPLGMGILVIIAYALPIIAGVQQPIGLLIVAFALWEAWKLNKRVPIMFNGPFLVRPPDLKELPPEGAPSHA